MTETPRQELQNTPAPAGQAARPAAAPADTRAMLPRVDVFEDERGITLLADLPGVAREQLDIRVDGETLTIEGSVSPAAPTALQPAYVELRVPRYRRAFTLSRELDAAHIEANLKDGVLNLRIPKLAHAQPRRISVNVA
ncbi:Hsp20/alpha crystallin family protein [Ideonella sp.]|uniref:Hsp20/alpha crystallin family protein n=1 Tax=Ideonella sp. TaxID=1929293 RepID=UPI0035B22792